MKVADVIQGQHLLTAELGTPIGVIADLMKEHHVTGVPIVDEWGALAGLVTSSMVLELARAWAPKVHEVPMDPGWHPTSGPTLAFPWTALKARDVMTSDLCTVMHDHDLSEAAQGMITRGVHRAIVLGKDRNVLGVISSLDFVRMAAEGKLA